jgi:hypothetical protein
MIIVWVLKKKLPKGMRFKLYGRGVGSARKNGNYGSIPIRYCKRVAIYIYFYDDYRDRTDKLYGENWKLKNEVEKLEEENSTDFDRLVQKNERIEWLEEKLREYELKEYEGKMVGTEKLFKGD